MLSRVGGAGELCLSVIVSPSVFRNAGNLFSRTCDEHAPRGNDPFARLSIRVWYRIHTYIGTHRYATPTEVYFETLIAAWRGHYRALVATRQEIRSVYLGPLVLLRTYSIWNSIPPGLMRIYQSECNLDD